MSRRRPTLPSTSVGGASCPGSSTHTRTWSSPVTGSASSPPAWRVSRTRPAGSGPPSPPPERPTTTCSGRTVCGSLASCCTQASRPSRRRSGYGLDAPTEQRSLRIAAESPPRRRSSARTSSARGRRPRRLPRPGHRPDARRLRTARSMGRRVLRAGRLRRRREPRDPAGRTGRGLGAAACTPTSSAHGPGVQLAVELGAASADHCTHLTDADVDALASRDTVATLLPGAEFSTRSPYPDARRLLDAGVTVALATDCNPGSGYSTSMPFCDRAGGARDADDPGRGGLGGDRGGARALRREDIGRARPGRAPTCSCSTRPSYVHLAYRPGVPLVAQVWRAGRPVAGPRRSADREQ